MALRNYYVILGVELHDGPRKIREAFHDLAWRYHPDRAGTGSAHLFQEIVEAYRVLSHPRSRAEYDRMLRMPEALALRSEVARDEVRPVSPFQMPAPAPAPAPNRARLQLQAQRTDLPVHVPWKPSFPEPVRAVQYHYVARPPMHALLRRYKASLARDGANGLEPLDMEILLSPEEALQGGAVTLEVPVLHPCASCQGAGALWMSRCAACEGTGATAEVRAVTLHLPPMRSDETFELALRGLGLHGMYLRVRSRVGRAERGDA